jgi:hypothetical protein
MKLLDLQTIIDIAVMTTGDAAQAVDIAINNNISITDQVSELNVQSVDNLITQHYKINKFTPATDFIEEPYKIFDYTFDETFE